MHCETKERGSFQCDRRVVKSEAMECTPVRVKEIGKSSYELVELALRSQYVGFPVKSMSPIGPVEFMIPQTSVTRV